MLCCYHDVDGRIFHPLVSIDCCTFCTEVACVPYLPTFFFLTLYSTYSRCAVIFSLSTFAISGLRFFYVCPSCFFDHEELVIFLLSFRQSAVG